MLLRLSRAPSQLGPCVRGSVAFEILLMVVNLTTRLLRAPVPCPSQLAHASQVTPQVRGAPVQPAFSTLAPLLPASPEHRPGDLETAPAGVLGGAHPISLPLKIGAGSSTAGGASLETQWLTLTQLRGHVSPGSSCIQERNTNLGKESGKVLISFEQNL